MFTNRWPPQKDGADSFKRLLGGRATAPQLYDDLSQPKQNRKSCRTYNEKHARPEDGIYERGREGTVRGYQERSPLIGLARRVAGRVLHGASRSA